MIISINPTSYRNAIELINLNVDRITIGQPEFSLRNSCYLSIEETKELLKNKKNTKVIVLVNKIFFDTELQKLEQYLLEISKLDIDGIEFADYAVLQILYENNLSKNIYTIYNPETLVVSYQQFPFYLDNDIDEVFIAREINQLQINEIGHNKNNMKIGMQACGYSYMMQSRWDLLTNFSKSHTNIKESLVNRKLYLKEEKREQPYIIYEDKDGTHNFTGYNLNLVSCLKQIKEDGVDVCRIDTFLHDEKWTNKVAEIFININNDLNNNVWNEERMKTYASEIASLQDEYQSKGFYKSLPEDLVYLEQYQSKPNND